MPPTSPDRTIVSIRIADYPQLRRLSWQLVPDAALAPEEAWGIYERNWRHADVAALDAAERQLLSELARVLGRRPLLDVERARRRREMPVLATMDADLLAALHCMFGGAAAIALRYGGYRASVGIDFLVSDEAGYRELRQRLMGKDGLRAIARPGTEWMAADEVRADPYGIRTSVRAGETRIDFKIVREARFELETPGPTDKIGDIATLTPLDMAASKLLANSDRWADDSVFSRDLIDLAMMQPGTALLRRAASKARLAYGESIDTDLARAARALLNRPDRMTRCMARLQMTSVPPALLRQRIKALLLRMSPSKSDPPSR